MKQHIGMLGLATCLTGCFTAQTLTEKHPAGFSLLVGVAPQCADPSMESYTACDVGAGMLEAPPRRVVVMLLAHIERTLSQFDDEILRYKVQGDVIAGGVFQQGRATQIDLISRIDVEAAKAALRRAPNDPYAQAMIPQLDLLVPDSVSSRESLREAHMAALANAGTQ